MIPAEHVQEVERVRTLFHRAIDLMNMSDSLRALLPGSPALCGVVEGAEKVAAVPRLNRPCDGRVVCAVIGASGHGKTTFMNDLFPGLGARGWLVTEKNDTTSQSLRIEYAAGPDALERVEVHSWDLGQIIRLVDSPGATEQNERDGIRVDYREDSVVVDGSKAKFPKSDLQAFRFALKQELRPLSGPLTVPPEKLGDRRFIRALTIKELPDMLSDRPVVNDGGHPFNALQLRAVVKDVTLHDPFERVASLCGTEPETVKDLVFVDTPGLATASSLKDEVLRHCLEQKSNRIVLELWKDDDLDVIVHLVLCGEQSNFATLWKAVEAECGTEAMSDLEKRLVLLVNGMNIYFENPDISKKFQNPAIASAEGDHFAMTVVDNVLQKMSPRGKVHPARVCFVDSQKFVGSSDPNAYAARYAEYRRHMARWVEPGGVGRSTLEGLGILDDFRENLKALCDPDDRGQGFLLRQIHDLARTQGPALLSRKYLKKTGLFKAVRDLRAALRRYYNDDGTLSREAVAEALGGCLHFLDPDDPRSIETFASEAVDPFVSNFFEGRDEPAPGDGWVADAFRKTAALVRDGVLARSGAGGEVARAFGSYYEDLVENWADRWGYASATLSPPSRRSPETGELVKHSLKIHGREIVYQLASEVANGGGTAFRQDESDRRVVRDLIETLAQAERLADHCRNGEHWL